MDFCLKEKSTKKLSVHVTQNDHPSPLILKYILLLMANWLSIKLVLSCDKMVLLISGSARGKLGERIYTHNMCSRGVICRESVACFG
jgi:hypothetical protein